MTKSYLRTNSLSIRGGSDSSLSGRRRDQRVRAPRERNSQGSVPASRTPVVEHNDAHPSFQSIHAILELKCIINFNSLPYLMYCASKIHLLKKKVRSLIGDCPFFFSIIITGLRISIKCVQLQNASELEYKVAPPFLIYLLIAEATEGERE